MTCLPTYRTADPYSRLRVPVYRKMFEAVFFLSLLLLYYSVLVERKQNGLGFFETLMDVWIAAFAYDELSGLVDAGVLFYQMDFWSLWNLGIIGVGVSFIITSESTVFSLPCQSSVSRLDLLQFLGLTRLQGSLGWRGETTTLSTCHSISCPSRLCFWFQGRFTCIFGPV